MNAIIYYSNTNECLRIAKYIQLKTGYSLLNIERLKEFTFDHIYLIFPIHYQSIPKEIKPILKKINAQKAIPLLAYGKMSYGNALLDLKKILNAKIVAGAYIPTKHCYIENDTKFDEFDKLDSILQLMERDEEANIKKGKKNIFSNLFPLLRHQMGVRIKRNTNCVSCHKCDSLCSKIHDGKIIDKSCNRCLKCYYSCPYKGLDFKLSFPMRIYFKKKKINKFIIY